MKPIRLPHFNTYLLPREKDAAKNITSCPRDIDLDTIVVLPDGCVATVGELMTYLAPDDEPPAWLVDAYPNRSHRWYEDYLVAAAVYIQDCDDE